MAEFGFVAPAPAVGPLAIDAQEGVVLRNRSSVNLWPDPHALSADYLQGQYVTYANDNPLGLGRSWLVNGQTTAGHTVWSAPIDVRGIGERMASQNVQVSCWLKGGADYIYAGQNRGPGDGTVYVRAVRPDMTPIGQAFPPIVEPDVSKSWTRYTGVPFSAGSFGGGITSWTQVSFIQVGLWACYGDVYFAELELLVEINAGDRVVWRALAGGGLMGDDTMPNKTRDIIALQRALLG